MSKHPFGAAMRPDFCLQDDAVFLNHGSFGATPRAVVRAQDQWRARMESQPVDFLVRQLLDLLHTTLEELAGFVGARARDLAFAENATTAINCVAQSLAASMALAPGDEILLTSSAHPGSRNPFTHVAAQRGARIVEVALPYPVHDEHDIIEPVRRALSPRTRLAVFDHISSATALRMPITGPRGLIALCHDAGVPVLIDGAHAPGHIDLDIEAIGADYYVGNCHKWLFAPRGCAFLWADEARQPGLRPAVIGDRFAMARNWADEFLWVGTRDPSAWLALSDALAWVRERGPRAIREHNRELCERASRHLLARLGSLPGGMDPAWRDGSPIPRDMRCAMATVPIGPPPAAGQAEAPEQLDQAARALNLELWQRHRIEVPIMAYGGRLWVRISAQVYNTIEQYELLADCLVGRLAG